MFTEDHKNLLYVFKQKNLNESDQKCAKRLKKYKTFPPSQKSP